MSVNKAILVGNVGNDPELITLPSGVKVAKLSLATNESYKNKDGEKVTNTVWHRLTAFAQIAELIEKYVHKGDQIYAEGKINNYSYEKDGIKMYSSEIIVNSITFLGKKETIVGEVKPTEDIKVEDFPGDGLPF